MKRISIYVLILILLNACATKKILPKGTTVLTHDISSGFIPNRGFVSSKDSLMSSYGTVFFDATKRSAISNIYNDELKVKFLAEEQPDAAANYVQKIVSDITSSFKRNKKVDSATIGATGKFTKDLTINISKLTKKSNSLNYLRTALHRLNEAYYNENVDSTYLNIFSKVLTHTKEIQLAELKKDSIVLKYQLENKTKSVKKDKK